MYTSDILGGLQHDIIFALIFLFFSAVIKQKKKQTKKKTSSENFSFVSIFFRRFWSLENVNLQWEN